MKNKNRYIVDSSNRLIIKRKHKRLISDGRFSVDKNNRLNFWLNEPASWRRVYDLPPKIIFKGNWKFNPNYDLELNLNETKDQYAGDRLILKGEIVSIDRDALVFEITGWDKQGVTYIRILKLAGFWQADEYNRLSFSVEKKTAPDVLTLKGIWQVNQKQQIIYTYEKTDLKTKTKIINTFAFQGFWQINSSNILTYILEHSPKSRFDFRVQIETPNLYPKEGVIKYRLGIGLKGLSPKGTVPAKIISLYGTWKFSRRAGLTFQMDYGRDKIQTIEFGADIYLSKRDEAVLALTNKRKEPLGIKITFTHRFLKKLDAQAFLRLKEQGKEKGIEVGLKIPF